MASLTQLSTWSNDLAIAAQILSDHCQSNGATFTDDLTFKGSASADVARARRDIFTISNRLRTLSAEPQDFIQHLTSQSQLLACLNWLREFQILACIPLVGSIHTKEVADLAGVPEMQLCRIVRMTATAGFLHEPQLGHIAHTTLSAPFVTDLSFLDATMFLAETVAPTALQMPSATQRRKDSSRSSDNPYCIAFNTPQPFLLACAERPKLQRAWSAYRRYTERMDDIVVDLLGRLNWRCLGSACIVDVEAATALAETHPALHFIVQLNEAASNGNDIIGGGVTESSGQRITVQKRIPASVQSVKDAAVYILRLTTPSPDLPAYIVAELNAHLDVLRTNASATLILAPPLLPEAGTVDLDIEAMARTQDLCRLQLTGHCDLELSELIGIVSSVHDGSGRLIVVSKLRSTNSFTVALGVRYQAYTSGIHPAVEQMIL
ncbi:hypothetical protein K431DRAFT_302017 [Polychaeton citri CBS 116435]|uniref:Uncharacterized protein n=1 Tax=Polychaeton citri CBS 116435 TaxID=1314669 RepID=A0A9P4QDR6_9PEZI|nr:hypothetical protein K431DRAFT_302017 [Polychaeton citri CBS 116435]